MMKTDQEILQLAMEDISIIKEAQSSEEPLLLLQYAHHLIQAYKDFMQMVEEEWPPERPWAQEPKSRVCVLRGAR